ncbi:UNVERIFIED_CONTAM: hypothetical protein FKN15_070294 [Acipenser sinensis]
MNASISSFRKPRSVSREQPAAANRVEEIDDRRSDATRPAADPDWASYKLGVFICLNCSGIHRNLTEISRVKSIRLDFWDDDLVEFMKANGNAVAKERYEKNVPAFFYRPQATDCAVLREQWIRAKYERQEFSGNNEDPQDMTCSGPKAVISIKDLNATFQPEKIKHPHGLQITYLKEDHTRSIFVYHEGTQEIVSWFNAIRAARFSYLKTAFPTASDSEQREPFKKRWFILDSQDRKLLYFKDPLWKPTSDEGDDIGGAAADISEELDLELCCPGGH